MAARRRLEYEQTSLVFARCLKLQILDRKHQRAALDEAYGGLTKVESEVASLSRMIDASQKMNQIYMMDALNTISELSEGLDQVFSQIAYSSSAQLDSLRIQELELMKDLSQDFLNSDLGSFGQGSDKPTNHLDAIPELEYSDNADKLPPYAETGEPNDVYKTYFKKQTLPTQRQSSIGSRTELLGKADISDRDSFFLKVEGLSSQARVKIARNQEVERESLGKTTITKHILVKKALQEEVLNHKRSQSSLENLRHNQQRSTASRSKPESLGQVRGLG